MRTLSLPIFDKPRPAGNVASAGAGLDGAGLDGARLDTADQAIDRSKPYPSCIWLEGGLAFNRRSLNACLITHHGTGFPHLCDYNGGPVDLNAVLAGRARVIRENQNGGHEACRGCPNLVTKDWRQPRHAVRLLAIAQFSHCNIECNYCYLQTQDPAVFSSGFDPYAVLPAIRQLSQQGVFDPHLIVDWGGGEPTIYNEFDDVLEFLTKQGATTWVHTNGTRLPKPIKQGLPTKRINILCSVDAGTRATWKLIKRKDLLETVWRNLAEYIRRGCRVQLKYIMKEENSSEAELKAFLKRALKIGAKELVLDIDYDYPDPSPAVVTGIQTLRRRATAAGMHVTFGSTGAQYTPEIDAAAKVNDDRAPGRLQRAELWVKDRFAYLMTQVRIVVRILRYS